MKGFRQRHYPILEARRPEITSRAHPVPFLPPPETPVGLPAEWSARKETRNSIGSSFRKIQTYSRRIRSYFRKTGSDFRTILRPALQSAAQRRPLMLRPLAFPGASLPDP